MLCELCIDRISIRNKPPSVHVVNPNQLPLLIQEPLRVEGPGVLPVLRVVVDGEDVAPDLKWSKSHFVRFQPRFVYDKALTIRRSHGHDKHIGPHPTCAI